MQAGESYAYDSPPGQSTQQDPIGIAGGANVYGFASGDPINFSDPFGLMPAWELAALAVKSKVNPTGGVVRGCDTNYGCGNFGASRDGGARSHAGADYTGTEGQGVRAVISGTVRIGRPYASGKDAETLQLVEITAFDGSETAKQMYVSPGSGIQNGAVVLAGQTIGALQSLQGRYKGITEHSHTELRRDGAAIDPASVIP